MKHSRRIIRTTTIGLLIMVIIMITHYTGMLSIIQRPATHAVNAITAPIYQARTATTQWTSQHLCRIPTDTAVLHDRINTLTQQNAQLSQELREFEQIKQITDYTTTHNHQYIIANIVGTVGDPGTNALILNKGLRDGIKEGYAVIAEHGMVVGKTASVTDSTSHLILLNDRRSTIAATLTNNAKATGLVQGQFGLGLTMSMIPSTESLERQAVVVTSGFETGIPGGLVIGTIDAIQRNDAALFQEAILMPALRYDQLSIVSIIIAPR